MNEFDMISKKIQELETNIHVKNYFIDQERLSTYIDIGTLVNQKEQELKQKYGSHFLKEWANKLSNQFGKGYNYRNLYRMKQLAIIMNQSNSIHQNILTTVLSKLSWSHWLLLLSIEEETELYYYINISIENCLSVRGLKNLMKSKAYD